MGAWLATLRAERKKTTTRSVHQCKFNIYMYMYKCENQKKEKKVRVGNSIQKYAVFSECTGDEIEGGCLRFKQKKKKKKKR